MAGFSGGAGMVMKTIGKGGHKLGTLTAKTADEAVEIATAAGKEVAEKNARKAAKVQAKNAAREAKVANTKRINDAYDEAAGVVKEAKGVGTDGDDVVSKAIQYKSKAQEATSFTYGGTQYTKANDGNYYSRTSSKEKASIIDQAVYEDMHAKYVDEMTEVGRQKDIDAAFGITMTAHEVWDGISSWAKEHPWHIAGGVAAGALLLSDD